MFNIGMGELLFIIVLALVVVGPERLPEIMRKIGEYVYQLRTIVNELTDQFADELRPLQEIQQLSNDLNPIKQVTKIATDITPETSDSAKRTSKQASQPSATSDATPATLVKPTTAFNAPPPATNPIKLIGQSLQAPAVSADGSSDTNASDTTV